MKKEIILRDYHLKRGDKLNSGAEMLEFVKMDGMYAQWKREDGTIGVGNFMYIIKGEDGVYIPYKKE